MENSRIENYQNRTFSEIEYFPKWNYFNDESIFKMKHFQKWNIFQDGKNSISNFSKWIISKFRFESFQVRKFANWTIFKTYSLMNFIFKSLIILEFRIGFFQYERIINRKFHKSKIRSIEKFQYWELLTYKVFGIWNDHK